MEVCACALVCFDGSGIFVSEPLGKDEEEPVCTAGVESVGFEVRTGCATVTLAAWPRTLRPLGAKIGLPFALTALLTTVDSLAESDLAAKAESFASEGVSCCSPALLESVVETSLATPARTGPWTVVFESAPCCPVALPAVWSRVSRTTWANAGLPSAPVALLAKFDKREDDRSPVELATVELAKILNMNSVLSSQREARARP